MQRDYGRKKFPTSTVAIIAVVIAVAVILMAVFAYLSSTNPYYGYGGNSGYYGGMMGGYGGVSMLFMIPIGLIVLLVIGYFIWRSVNWGSCDSEGHTGHYSSNAMEIVQQRYARGEISKEQFEQMKKDIVG
jgi:putative membrane protein